MVDVGFAGAFFTATSFVGSEGDEQPHPAVHADSKPDALNASDAPAT
jgi:hypothetical protein